METLQISKTAAIQAHDNANKHGKKLLTDLFGKDTFILDIKDRIKTFNDALEYHGILKEEFNGKCIGLESDEVAYLKVKLIVSALNEGWKPDWDNSSQYKYYPWFDMRSSSGGGFAFDAYVNWLTSSTVGSRLCFKSRELSNYAGKQFEDVYKDLFTL